MREVYFNYDINSHIKIKSCHLEEKEFRKYVSIDIFNLGRVPIKSLKLLAYGKDQDGNDVLFNGINRYLLPFNDLNIKDRGIVIGLLPANEITDITLQEYSIEYKDGSSVGYMGEEFIDYILQQYEVEDGLEKLQQQNSRYKYKPILLNDGWVCACGRYNIRQSCVVCQSDKDTILSLFDHLEMLDHPKGNPVITENEWVCSCGRFNTTEVCSSCGKKKNYIYYTTTSTYKKKKNKRWMKFAGIVSAVIVTFVLAGVIYFKSTIQTYDNPNMMADSILGIYSYESKDHDEF